MFFVQVDQDGSVTSVNLIFPVTLLGAAQVITGTPTVDVYRHGQSSTPAIVEENINATVQTAGASYYFPVTLANLAAGGLYYAECSYVVSGNTRYTTLWFNGY